MNNATTEFSPGRQEAQQQTRAIFTKWATDHSRDMRGLLTVADPSDARYAPYADLDQFSYDALKIDCLGPYRHQAVVELMHQATDHIMAPGSLQEFTSAFKKRSELLDQISERLAQKKNMAIIVNHPWLINVGILQAALYEAMGSHDFTQHSALILNKMLGFMNFKDSSTIQIMQTIANIYCVVPRTEAARKQETELIKNTGHKLADYTGEKQALEDLIKRLRSGIGTVLTVAPSGSRDIVNEKTGTIIMQNIGPTAQFLGKESRFGLILPVVTVLDPKTNRLSFNIGELTSVSGPQQVHELMESMVDPYQQLVDNSSLNGLTVEYAQPYQTVAMTKLSRVAIQTL